MTHEQRAWDEAKETEMIRKALATPAFVEETLRNGGALLIGLSNVETTAQEETK